MLWGEWSRPAETLKRKPCSPKQQLFILVTNFLLWIEMHGATWFQNLFNKCLIILEIISPYVAISNVVVTPPPLAELMDYLSVSSSWRLMRSSKALRYVVCAVNFPCTQITHTHKTTLREQSKSMCAHIIMKYV